MSHKACIHVRFCVFLFFVYVISQAATVRLPMPPRQIKNWRIMHSSLLVSTCIMNVKKVFRITQIDPHAIRNTVEIKVKYRWPLTQTD